MATKPTEPANVEACSAPQEPGTDASSQHPKSGDAPRHGLGADHPLASIIGTHQGEAWEATLRAIQRNRREQIREEFGE
jgi:hypothetical protein